MSTINVVVAIDTQSLSGIKGSDNPNKPLPVRHVFAYMVAEPQYVQSGQGTGDLTLKAKTGDVVRWISQSLYGEEKIYAIICGISKYIPSDPVVLDHFEAVTNQDKEPVPSGNDALSYKMKEQYSFFYQASVVGKGSEHYGVTFYLVKVNPDGTDTNLGYYNWDPMITVTD